MTDLPTRLRALYVRDGTNYVQWAADELERLSAELVAEKAETFRLQCSHSTLYALVETLKTELAAMKSE